MADEAFREGDVRHPAARAPARAAGRARRGPIWRATSRSRSPWPRMRRGSAAPPPAAEAWRRRQRMARRRPARPAAAEPRDAPRRRRRRIGAHRADRGRWRRRRSPGRRSRRLRSAHARPVTCSSSRASIRQRSFARAEVGRLLEPGAGPRSRRPARTIERDRCGGCQLQHLDAGAQRAARRAIVGRCAAARGPARRRAIPMLEPAVASGTTAPGSPSHPSRMGVASDSTGSAGRARSSTWSAAARRAGLQELWHVRAARSAASFRRASSP